MLDQQARPGEVKEGRRESFEEGEAWRRGAVLTLTTADHWLIRKGNFFDKIEDGENDIDKKP